MFKPNQKLYTIGYNMQGNHVVCTTTFAYYLPENEIKTGKNHDGTTYVQDCVTNEGFMMLNQADTLFATKNEALTYLKENY